MHRLLTPALVVLLVLTGCTKDVEDPPEDEQGSSALADPCDEEAIAAWGEAGFRGTVVLATEGEVTCEVAEGVDDGAVFAIGSVSKAFTAAAVLDLVAEGELALDARAGDLVPGLGGPAATATVEQLLLHTSGLTGSHGEDHEPLAKDEAIAAIGSLEQEPPGAFLYSNAGYTLLALIVEEVGGSDYREQVVERALRVDGERIGGFWDGEPAAPGPRADSSLGGDVAGPHWALAGNGDLAMTTAELARWTHGLFTGTVIPDAAVDLLEGTAIAHDEGTEEVPGWVRFDAERFGEPVYAVAGGGGDIGHDVVTAWLPESERVVTIASNTDDVTSEDLLAVLAPALVAGEPLPRPPTAGSVDPAEVAALAGSYELDDGSSIAVAADEDGLSLTADGAAAIAALFPPADADEAAERADHEDLVRALLAGETAAGREELELLEEDLGPITDVTVLGSIDDGELKTYVALTAEGEETRAWYALDEAGGVGAVELTDDGPALVVAPSGDDDTWVPADPTADGPDVSVAFADGTMTLTGPDGAVTARRS
jgi:CubicO group peptidase (beta-lactamase class C family)